ncbi:MAG: energy transducer TonB [Tannerella sp.]|jgi:TonB family protein|nr:energy transducer TonB [Tannerella sp.]
MNQLLKYIQGERKGKEAHRLEREAMQDPFLAEALEGFEAVDSFHAERIMSVRKRLSSRTRRTYLRTGRIAAAASLLLCILAGSYFLLNRPLSDRFIAQSNHPAETAVEEIVSERTADMLYPEDTPVCEAASLPDTAVEEKRMLKMMKKATVNHVPEVSTEKKPSLPAPEPQIGMKAYREYLTREMIRPSEETCARMKGTVEIQFRIDAQGKPYDFTVKRSLCTEADREAIRLIERGSRWKGDPSQPVTVEVTF